MSKRGNPTVIGMFVVGAIALLLGGIAVFGSGSLFTSKYRFMMHFDGSVKGLRKGAPMAMQGVAIGVVEEIDLVFPPDSNTPRIRVIVAMDEARLQWLAALKRSGSFLDGPMLPGLIERGMRARLQLESFVTGQLFVDLSFHPDTVPELPLAQYPYLEIPTIPSALQEITQTIEELPLREIIYRAGEVLKRTHEILSSPGLDDSADSLGEAIRQIRSTFVEAEQFLKSIKREVGPVAKDIHRAAVALEDALAGTTRVVQSIESAVGDDSVMRYELEETLRSIRRAAQSLQQLSDYLERNPNALIVGK